MKTKQFLLLLFSICCHHITAQEARILTQKFQFTDGIYTSFKEFQSNQPSLSWDAIETEIHIDKAGHLIRVSKVGALASDAIWGICYQGIPFINLSNIVQDESLSWQESEPFIFANLQSRGKLCYFYYEGYTKVKVPITVYDPISKRPLKTTFVENKEPVVMKRILNFETGEIVNYSLENFMQLIENDKKLWDTLDDLSPEEAREKMYKSLFIYNDRNEVFIR